METMKERYKRMLTSFEAQKRSLMDIIVTELKVIALYPLTIGNMVYWVTEYNGEVVPAYCYLTDYKGDGTDKFYPIYNDGQSEEDFGWTDFTECCRIFDVIREKLFSK